MTTGEAAADDRTRYHTAATARPTIMPHSPSPPLIVFDWDGTLMDSIGNMVDCALDAFRCAELQAPPPVAIRSAIGLGLDEVAERILPRHDQASRRRLLDCYRDRWIDEYRHRVTLYDGVPEALGALAGQGHVLAVATGRSRLGLDADLATTGLGPSFAYTRTADEAPSKPHPRMLLDVLESLDVAADEALMIGDTSYDMEMARRAGVAAIGVLTGSHGRADLEPFDPWACLASVADLPTYLDERASA